MLTFVARIITGSGRGKGMGTPTLNLDLSDVPVELKEGIYACKVGIDGKKYDAAMHYGPRPVHKDTRSCEVHLLLGDEEKVKVKEKSLLSVDVIEYIREVRNFPFEAALIAQIHDDIEKARAILREYDATIETTDS